MREPETPSGPYQLRWRWILDPRIIDEVALMNMLRRSNSGMNY